MSKDNRLGEFLLCAWLLGAFDKDKTVQELYDEGYSPDEIADELDMDEDDIKDIVDDYEDYDY